jgi:hypothetical protein
MTTSSSQNFSSQQTHLATVNVNTLRLFAVNLTALTAELRRFMPNDMSELQQIRRIIHLEVHWIRRPTGFILISNVFACAYLSRFRGYCDLSVFAP